MTDADQLTRRLARNVDRAFPEVVGEFQNGLYATALRLTGSTHDAEDLTQDALVRAYRAMSSYEPARIRSLQLRGWLWTILLNLVRNRARTRSRKPPTHDLGSVPAPPSQMDTAAVAVATVDVGKALAVLRPIEREVIVLHHVADLGFDEIAEVTGRPVGTVKSHAHRSLSRLRTILEEGER